MEANSTLSDRYLHFWPNPEEKFLLMALSHNGSINANENCKHQHKSQGISLTFFHESANPLNMPQEVQNQSDSQLLETVLVGELYLAKQNVVFVGDAAHTILPFYGQGLNAGLEDVRILSLLPSLMKEHLQRYSEQRVLDSRAICAMAENHALRILSDQSRSWLSMLEYHLVSFHPEYSYSGIRVFIDGLQMGLFLAAMSLFVFASMWFYYYYRYTKLAP